MQYQGITGKLYSAEDNRIARGGEGNIYPIKDQNNLVVKIFKPEKRTVDREEKLKAMVKTKLSTSALEQVVWPLDVVYEQGAFAGYVMPKLNNTDSLITLYSSGTVGRYDLRHRLLTAINLCYAIQTIHSMGQVCGDLNPQNICVNLDEKDRSKNFHVTLVDVDSYHYTSEGKNYRCEVGLSEYLAPEIQEKLSGGQSLRDIPLPTYTKETDLFALAVHIFTLLMNGCHPFACAREVSNQQGNNQSSPADTSFNGTIRQMDQYFLKNSVVAPQPNENMKNGFFPFYERRTGITIPVYAPTFDFLPDNIRNLFVRTFVMGFKHPAQRADSGEWIAALKGLIDQKHIMKCQFNMQHYYFAHQVSCPLCAVEQRIKEMNMRWSTDTLSLPPAVSDAKSLSVASGNIQGNAADTSQNTDREDDAQKLAWILAGILILTIFCVSLFEVMTTDRQWQNSEIEETEETQIEGGANVFVEVCTSYGEAISRREDAYRYRLLLKLSAYPSGDDYDYIMPLIGEDKNGGYIPSGHYYVSLYCENADGEMQLLSKLGTLDVPQNTDGEDYYEVLTLPEGVDATLP